MNQSRWPAWVCLWQRTEVHWCTSEDQNIEKKIHESYQTQIKEPGKQLINNTLGYYATETVRYAVLASVLFLVSGHTRG